jgi:hypothetical protein
MKNDHDPMATERDEALVAIALIFMISVVLIIVVWAIG